ncbi:MAG: hypothetical protein AAB295_06385 [Chloroflexota bacterium]
MRFDKLTLPLMLTVAVSCASPHAGTRFEALEIAKVISVNARDIGIALNEAKLSAPAGVATKYLENVSARLASVEAARTAAGVDPATVLTADEWREVLIPGLSPGMILGSLIANPRQPDETRRSHMIRVLLYIVERAPAADAPAASADPS